MQEVLREFDDPNNSWAALALVAPRKLTDACKDAEASVCLYCHGTAHIHWDCPLALKNSGNDKAVHT